MPKVLLYIFTVKYALLFCKYYNVNEVLDISRDSGDCPHADILLESFVVDELTDEDSLANDMGKTIQNLNGRLLTDEPGQGRKF